ncbi:MAG: hypothetical protein WCH32_16355, partial [Pseudomonadota bacterium]
ATVAAGSARPCASVGGSSYRGGGSTGLAVGLGAQIKKIDVRYAVVKCVADESPAAPAAAAAAPAGVVHEAAPTVAPQTESAIAPK